MDKEEALGILKDLYEKSIFSERKALETFVPELKKSEDEKIKTFIRGLLLPHISYIHFDGDRIIPNKDIDLYRKALFWLEKHGEKECTTNVDEMLSNYRQKLKDEDFDSMPSPFCEYNPEVYDGKSLIEKPLTIGKCKLTGKAAELAKEVTPESLEEARKKLIAEEKVNRQKDIKFIDILIHIFDINYIDAYYKISMPDLYTISAKEIIERLIELKERLSS